MATLFVGMRERVDGDNHFIQWAHSLVGLGNDVPDEIPWCSSWLCAIAFLCKLPNPKSAAARRWLEIGIPISLQEAEPGNDVVILMRGGGDQPGPEVTRDAPGHVGLFAGYDPMRDQVEILGGNQSDSVCIARFPAERILGLRRLEA